MLTSTEWHFDVIVPANTEPSLVQCPLTRQRIPFRFAFSMRPYRTIWVSIHNPTAAVK